MFYSQISLLINFFCHCCQDAGQEDQDQFARHEALLRQYPEREVLVNLQISKVNMLRYF